MDIYDVLKIEEECIMKFVLWGAGDRGERILFHIGKENVLAIIDSDEKKQGKKYFGVDVISYKQYKEDYDHACIVITTAERTIANILMRDHNFKFLYMNDCPEDFQSPNPRNILKNNILRQVQKDNRYVVYGNNLYTLLLWG
jgi:FlaA1/EpsC-like NDP-sugar epimerase